MIVANAVKAAAAAIAGSLAGSLAFNSGRNMLQTRQICRQGTPAISTTPTSVEELQKMNRKELLELFVHQCEAPRSISEIQGEWNGSLLRNNGLTRVTRFMTNRLFGKGREWNGKVLSADSGVNRFERFSVIRDPKLKKTRSTVILVTEEDRPFQLGIATSRLDKKKLSAILDYSNKQNPRVWSGMNDEIRVVPSTNGRILLGMGSISWSGGKLNAAPFCLYKRGKQL